MKAKITIEYEDGAVFRANASECYHDLFDSAGSTAASVMIKACGITELFSSVVEYDTEEITDDDNEDKQLEDL